MRIGDIVGILDAPFIHAEELVNVLRLIGTGLEAPRAEFGVTDHFRELASARLHRPRQREVRRFRPREASEAPGTRSRDRRPEFETVERSIIRKLRPVPARSCCNALAAGRNPFTPGDASPSTSSAGLVI